MEKKLQVAIPIFDKMTMLDAIGPYEILQTLPTVDVVFISHNPGLVSDSMGYLSINGTHSFEDVPKPDIVLVPGGMGVRELLNDETFISWLQKAHETTLYTTSVCTGALMLGSAGLLKGLKATTHWASLAELTKYGATPSESRVVKEGKIITSAGISSGMDMALQLAALITDETLAKTVQLFVEYDPQPPFDTGSLAKAGPELEEKARTLMAANRQRQLAMDKKDHKIYVERACKYRPVKVVEFDTPYQQCLVFLDLKLEECKALWPQGRLYSQAFHLGGQGFFLSAHCNMDANHPSSRCFGLFLGMQEKCTVSFAVDYEFAARMRPGWEFSPKSKGSYMFTGGKAVGYRNLFGLTWQEFISEDSKYFHNGVLHLRADLTIKAR